ncbi:Uncharacterized protein TCM_015024 [Theobroma cacao]|uniref:Uncharacterized protein n=1 Tax=Theobroma cacao TaxID=3641 RepID=A0A061FZN7_THECC|nr:Uncharacterized protein TCM_015024 [Theobroma cacao]
MRRFVELVLLRLEISEGREGPFLCLLMVVIKVVGDSLNASWMELGNLTGEVVEVKAGYGPCAREGSHSLGN